MTGVLGWILLYLVTGAVCWFLLQQIPNRLIQSFGIRVKKVTSKIIGHQTNCDLRERFRKILNSDEKIRFRLFNEGTIFIEKLPRTTVSYGKIQFHYPSFHLLISIQDRTIHAKILINPLSTLFNLSCLIGGPVAGILYFRSMPLAIAISIIFLLPGIAWLLISKSRRDGESLFKELVARISFDEMEQE